jgi:peptide deformylase
MKLTQRILHRSARPVTFDYPWKNKDLAERMMNFMRASGGIGLAAPQCGINSRVFVMKIRGWQWRCFNPQILDQSLALIELEEGCLSFPEKQCIITRPQWIDVRYQDYQGGWHSERLRDLDARCFQHELDHLDGITMIQRSEEQHAKQS